MNLLDNADFYYTQCHLSDFVFCFKNHKVIVFEEKEGDFKVLFEETPDLGMAADIL